MTFFYDLNKKLAGISTEQPKQQVNEGLGELSRSIAGAAKKIVPAAKKAGSAVLNTMGHGSDADMMRDLQKKMGVPQTGQKPQQVKEKLSPAKQKSFAALAEPKDKITFADKIAGAKKEVDEMLGDVAAAAIKKAVGGHKGKEEMESTGDYSPKKARAGKDIGKPGKNFAKIADKAGKKYGSKAAGERVAGAVLNKLRHPGELEENAAAGYDPETQARIKAATPQQLAQMAQEFAGGPAQYQSELKMLQQAKAELSGQMEEGWDDMLKDVEKRRGAMKTGEKIKGHKGEIEKTATGIRHTRSYDAKTGETDTGDDAPAAGEKRGRGRPKGPAKAPERVTAKATKHKGGRKVTDEGDFGPMEGAGEGEDMVKLAKVIQSCKTMDQLETARKMAQNFLRKHSSGNDGVSFASIGKDMRRRDAAVSDIERKKAELQGGEELEEKAVSKKQQKFMGMVHAAQKGEKPASKEVAKVAKTMKKKDAEDFASTKHKGLPEKKKPEGKKSEGKKEKTTEAGGTDTPTASSGFSYGKGIYDSMNFELEKMIAESMSINMSDSTEGGKSLTVTATDEDALELAELLNNAGLEGGEMGMDHEAGACPSCGEAPCGCDDEQVEVDENAPDWPTNTETSSDALQYSGGLNKPKSSGMATIPVTDVNIDGEDKFSTAARLKEAEEQFKHELRKMMETAGIQVSDEKLDEGWKEKLAAAGTAAAIGAAGLGMIGGGQAPNQNGAEFEPASANFSQNIRASHAVQAKADAFAKVNPQFAKEYQALWQKIDQESKTSKYPDVVIAQGAKQIQQLMAQYQANEGMFEQEQVMAPEEVEESLARFRSLAGIKEAKKADKDYDGDGKVETGAEEHAGSVDKAIKKAQAEKKVDESIFALTNMWKAYKG